MRTNPPQIQRLLSDLASPLHQKRLPSQSGRATRSQEADLRAGYQLVVADKAIANELRAGMTDFGQFMSRCIGLKARSTGYSIRLTRGSPIGCPTGAPEAFAVSVQASQCEITANDADGFRRALIWLEDEMSLRRAPCLPLGPHARWATIVDRITHSPCAVGRYGTGWELEDDGDYYPDEYLNKLAHCGVNGIWVTGPLRRLVASSVLPELGPRRHRLGKLKRLVERAGQYGIRVYLFGIEPRAVPHDHPVFRAHPEIKGATMCEVTAALCTSTPLVQEYVRGVMRSLFTEVPALGGIINIFNGERGTTCWLGPDFVRTCPRCRKRAQSDVLAEDLTVMMQGIRQASATAKLLAWTYCMNTTDSMTAGPVDPMLETIAKADKGIIWLGNFEHGGTKTVKGKTIGVNEYSLSYVGPSPSFSRITDNAAQHGAHCYAKIQVGNTYELSSAPYVPVPGIVYDKFAGMRSEKVDGAMLSWIIGGYPGLMLKAAGEAAFAPVASSRRAFLKRLAGLYWGECAALRVARAWEQFGAAFQLYPCINQILYFSPVTRCPAYHLDLRREQRLSLPYNWGIGLDRCEQPYEQDVTRWLGPFTAAELSAQFRQMARQWEAGLGALSAGSFTALQRQVAVAAAIRLQFLSMANVVEFYHLRKSLVSHVDCSVRRSNADASHFSVGQRRPRRAGTGTSLSNPCRAAGPEALALPGGNAQRSMLVRLRDIVKNDVALAREMKRHQAIDPFIGFESEMWAYSFSPTLLNAKIRQSRQTLRQLDAWIRSGIPPKTLGEPIPIEVKPQVDTFPRNRTCDRWLDYIYNRDNWQGPAPAVPTHRDWLQHGD